MITLVRLERRAVQERLRQCLVWPVLAYTRLKIANIATIDGYADPSILTHRFVRWTGATPSQWRGKLASKGGRLRRIRSFLNSL